MNSRVSRGLIILYRIPSPERDHKNKYRVFDVRIIIINTNTGLCRRVYYKVNYFMPLNLYTGRYGKFLTDNENNLFNIDVFNVILIDIFFYNYSFP